ncbi:MAG: ADP-ribosylation factor-like protein [Promethearchaeota archaeon]
MSSEPSKEKQLVDAICKRFLKPGTTFSSIQEILNAPISSLKKISEKDAKLLEEAGFLSTLGELALLDPQNPFHSLLEGKGDVDDPIRYSMLKKNIIERLSKRIPVELMRDIIIAARLITRAKKKQDFYIKEKKEQKILFLGLDNAGKTAIINVLGGKINASFLSRLRPTKRVQREKLMTKDFEIFIWDLGGQKEYRDMYLKKDNLEMFFLQTDMIVYVIDMQEPGRFDESLNYLNEILHTLKYLNEDPFILFFLHKSDPDLISDPEFQINLETIKERLMDIISPFDFEYDAYPTSIYYLYSKEAKFSKFIKGVLDEQKVAEQTKKDPIKALGEVLDTAINLTVNLANMVETEFQKINDRFNWLENRMNQLQRAVGMSKTGASVQKIPQIPTTPIVSKEVPHQAILDDVNALVSQTTGLQATPQDQQTVEVSTPQPMLSSSVKKTEHQNIRSTMMSELKAIFAKKKLESSN